MVQMRRASCSVLGDGGITATYARHCACLSRHFPADTRSAIHFLQIGGPCRASFLLFLSMTKGLLLLMDHGLPYPARTTARPRSFTQCILIATSLGLEQNSTGPVLRSETRESSRPERQERPGVRSLTKTDSHHITSRVESCTNYRQQTEPRHRDASQRTIHAPLAGTLI